MESTRRFGEPGFVWLENLDIIYNPCCLSGDTAITCENENISIKNIVEKFSHDKNIKVLSFNEETGQQDFKKVISAALTRKNAEVVKVFFRIKDNEDFEFSITCTPDHKFFVNGE